MVKTPHITLNNATLSKTKQLKSNGFNGKTLTKQSFRREINMMAKKTSKKKVLEMFATVIQAEHTKMSKSKKTKTRKKVLEDSSDSEESTASSNENHAMDIVTYDAEKANIEDNVKKTETDEETTYRKAIENLGAVTETK
jgi:hypothetical protein